MTTSSKVPQHPGGPVIFDRQLLGRRRTRAAADFDRFDFLKREVADRVVERLEPIQRQFRHALDLGAHHGAAAQLLAARYPDMDIVSTDLSPAFVARGAGPRVVADEEALPFAPTSFDLVISALSLHWVNDLPGSLIQINRALKPDGLFIGALFGLGTLGELREALSEAEVAITGGLSPRVSPFLDARDGAALLQRAGFALPVAERETIDVTYGDPLALLADLRGMGEANLLVDRRRIPLRRDVLALALDLYRQRHSKPDGRVRATFEIVTLTGWAPHEGQQKPLAPGSAKARLATALGVEERSAGEKVAKP
jgi:SAM-dependent methyltransferase